ncbi:putative Ankyrin repeat-containing protein [Quillaja saponaria]|uniref:Ankyrin repeat-containing protein n=1 Tax=Quillaja saponaria TaxID=32244 RepID=A0AAD7Q0W7_QUISA|nr:putative Ankyrin repeat-containing protein [Quillaja saponaria]
MDSTHTRETSKSTPSTTLSNSDIKQNLYNFALKSDWEQVIEIYKNYDWTHTSTITKSGDTALHVAVIDDKYNFVKQLVDIITEINPANASRALGIQNERGNTPLHFAASRGYVEMCVCIAQVDPSLVGSRNNGGETPLFLAALRGHKDTFLFLHTTCPDKIIQHCRRNGGQIILHCTIQREYFDLAIHIIYFYEDLVNSVDENGITPLHVLASKPSAFRSGNHLQWWTNIIYHCIIVDPLNVVIPSDVQLWKRTTSDEKKRSFPENYHTCFGFFKLLSTFAQVVTHGKHDKEDGVADIENQLVAVRGKGYRNFPENYATCYELLKSACKEVPGPTGFGLAGIRKIKEKHTWSCQIMDKLLQRNAMYSSQKTGSKPLTQSEEEEETNPYNIRREVETTPSDIRNKINPVKQESPQAGEAAILEAARNGVVEMLVGIRDQFPVSIPGTTVEKKNTLLVAVENKQPLILEISIKKNVTNLAEEAKITPFLEAAKNGVVEMVDRILDLFPVSIHDTTVDKKNILLVAVENRQPRIFEILREKNVLKNLIQSVDSNENTVLHLAAMLSKYKPWQIPGSCLANAMGNQVV